MRWGKLVLLFQAIVTLIIGFVFFTQVMAIDAAKISELKIEVQSGGPTNPISGFIDLKQRYASATYILILVALMEIIIVARFIS